MYELAVRFYCTLTADHRHELHSAALSWASRSPTNSGALQLLCLVYLKVARPFTAESTAAAVEHPLNSAHGRIQLIDAVCSYLEYNVNGMMAVNARLKSEAFLQVSLKEVSVSTDLVLRNSTVSLLHCWSAWRTLANALGPLVRLAWARRHTLGSVAGCVEKLVCSLSEAAMVLHECKLVSSGEADGWGASSRLDDLPVHEHVSAQSSGKEDSVVIETTASMWNDSTRDFFRNCFCDNKTWWSSSLFSAHTLPSVSLMKYRNAGLWEGSIYKALVSLRRITHDSTDKIRRVSTASIQMMKARLSEMIGVGLFLIPPLSQTDYTAPFYDDNFFQFNTKRPGHKELSDNLDQTIRELGTGDVDKVSFEAMEKMGDLSIADLASDILCFQIILKCHLSGGCQDNLFSVRAANMLINKSIEQWINYQGDSAPTFELPLEALCSRGLIFLSYMNFDLVRARRTYIYLNANKISGFLE